MKLALDNLTAAQEAARIELAGEDFLHYARWIYPEMRVSWHHRILARYLDKFAKGEITRLMIFAPPRHGKSQLVSRVLPGYVYTLNPSARIIACSYSARLAQKMSVAAQRLMDSQHWSKLNPDYGLGGSNVRTGSFKAKRNSDEFEVEHREHGILGGYVCAGVGGSVTGFGGDYAIIDDPVKAAAQAASALQRQNMKDWYGSTLYTRLQPNPGGVLIMHTRWDEDDLAGWLLKCQETDPEADKWTVVNLPAIMERTLPHLDPDDPRPEGAALWPAQFDLATLKKIRASIGPRWWNALYQGSPREAEGSLFKAAWFRFWDTHEDFGGYGNFKELAFTADLSFSGDHQSDYNVIQVWGRTQSGESYLLDQVRGKWDFVELQAAFETLRARWPTVRKLYLEKKANGDALLSTLRKSNSGLRIEAISPDKSKSLRCYAAQPEFQQGRVYFPRNAFFTPDLVKEFTTVRAGSNGDLGGAKYDDQVDAAVQIILEWSAGGLVDPRARLNRMKLLGNVRM